ncbi:TnsA endonuclease N-terminal domain-containing protein [Xanthomonas sp. NCPPB 1638]|uniref:TnsA endonuclease N-terminal domain-containing protein n=1 Tax=Xanthomonas TaxID=338 RepID=UPI00132E7D89|nr:TnsA endonuclease N-terminal domain-containing protein [Xanthomonas cucurbitae]QHG88224.1 heteromeric transposase endonuclease subunit TnsA [Xanthomonas cucurbitae]WDM74790.1 TnsA endonuclease N-terminal domain-containing protein [Xanthomonas cucurbitae]
MPVRKIPKNYRNVTGITAARKADGPAQFESTLERDFLTLLEFSPEVRLFEVQPVALSWRDGIRERRYTPDVLVRFQHQHGAEPTPLLYEVKYRTDLRADWAELRPKFRAAVRFAKAQGWRFKLITEREIRTPYLDNARFLLPYVLQVPPPAEDMDLLDEALQALREADVEGLLQAASRDEWTRARLMPAAWYLVGIRHFSADLHAPLTMHSRLWNK